MAAVAFHPAALPASATVTLDRGSFDILVRRANLNHNEGLTSSALPKHASVEGVFIPKTEYAQLLATADRYTRLQHHLMNGGVAPETIQLLSEEAAQPGSQQNSGSGAQIGGTNPKHSNGLSFNRDIGEQLKAHAASANKRLPAHGDYKKNRSSEPRQEWAEDHKQDVDGASDHDPAPEVQIPVPPGSVPVQTGQSKQSPLFPKDAQRTLMLMGLSERTTLADVTAAVRGGPLLSIHIRQSDRSAFVSFVYQEHAADFFQYVKRFGLLLSGKWVTIRWADKQSYLNGHIAFQIRGGATRNMIIRRCHARHTEASIRDDLEHIHNLVAISIEFLGGSCHIRTNSVQHAIVAKTCMMSRLKYMGSGIEWDVDECAQPLIWPDPVPRSSKHMAPIFGKTNVKSENFFTPLRMDDDKQSLHEDDSDAGFTSTYSSGSTF